MAIREIRRRSGFEKNQQTGKRSDPEDHNTDR